MKTRIKVVEKDGKITYIQQRKGINWNVFKKDFVPDDKDMILLMIVFFPITIIAFFGIITTYFFWFDIDTGIPDCYGEYIRYAQEAIDDLLYVEEKPKKAKPVKKVNYIKYP